MTSSVDPAFDNSGWRTEVDLSKTTLLVVDSKPLFRDMVRSAFLIRAKAVREATSVEKAAEILSRVGAGIHCVVCDWDMAPTGGLELLRMIRCRTIAGVSPRLPVVILTSRADAEAVKTAMELDVNGFAVTPVSLEKLISTVTGALSRTWMLQQPGHYIAVRGLAPPARPMLSVVSPRAPKAPFPAKPYNRRDTADSGRSLRNVRMCILEDVHPGAVLARDLRDREGHLLAARGTELQPAILRRLKSVGYALADSYCVWVGER